MAAVVNTPIFPQTLLSPVVQFTSGTSTTTATQLIGTQSNGIKLEQIIVSSTDIAHDINLYLQRSGTNYQICTVSIPATSGTIDSVPAVSVLKSSQLPLSTDNNGNPYLYLDSGTALYAAPAVALTSGKVWNILIDAGAY